MNKILVIGLIAVSMFSCKKDEFDYTSASEYLTGGGTKNWFLTEYYIDNVLQADSCNYDDTLKLSSNTDFAIVAGDTSCFLGEKTDTLHSGEWRVSSDDKIFYLFGIDAFGFEGAVSSMSGTKLVVSNVDKAGEKRKYVYETSRGY